MKRRPDVAMADTHSDVKQQVVHKFRELERNAFSCLTRKQLHDDYHSLFLGADSDVYFWCGYCWPRLSDPTSCLRHALAVWHDGDETASDKRSERGQCGHVPSVTKLQGGSKIEVPNDGGGECEVS